MSLLPVLMVGILFGLAMAYQFFLVTRMHEEHTHGADNDTAIAVGFQHGARVVTAAALIRFSIFAAFSFRRQPDPQVDRVRTLGRHPCGRLLGPHDTGPCPDEPRRGWNLVVARTSSAAVAQH
ncbi:MMPL family transporter [Nocardioides sp.]|uniref:MMPL family transporter n=1 Tax=Nocardioides sp. TaxID=35761 RepID=UPI0026305715|nr:MMPL family transporter [Nocardioides sp.]